MQRTMKVNKDIVILILSFALITLSYFHFKKTDSVLDDSLFKQRESELKQRIDSLQSVVNNETLIRDKYEQKLDSLQNIKEKIKYVYVSKNNKIDSASVSDVVSQFKSVFADGHVK